MSPVHSFPEIVDGLEAVELDRPFHMAIGMFDGVHLGHQAVIESAIHAARGAGGVSGVLTFHPHPSRLIAPGRATPLIQPRPVKERVLRNLGVDLIVWQEFNRHVANVAAQEFPSFLKRRVPALHTVYVGEDFRFGKGREGTVKTLIAEGNRLGFGVLSIERVRLNGEPISSSRIRSCLADGRLEEANTLLGYPYIAAGTVIEGRKVGRTLGFPTLNIPWSPECLPAYGVYGVRVTLPDGNRVTGVANFGVRPTVADDSAPLLEVHCLRPVDAGSGAFLVVEWLCFLRHERAFESLDELKAQIARDMERAKNMVDG